MLVSIGEQNCRLLYFSKIIYISVEIGPKIYLLQFLSFNGICNPQLEFRIVLLEVTFEDYLIQKPDHFRANKSSSILIKEISKYLLSTDRYRALTTLLGSHCYNTLMVKKWFVPFLHILSLVAKQ